MSVSTWDMLNFPYKKSVFAHRDSIHWDAELEVISLYPNLYERKQGDYRQNEPKIVFEVDRRSGSGQHAALFGWDGETA